jgi:hypothetical protein
MRDDVDLHSRIPKLCARGEGIGTPPLATIDMEPAVTVALAFINADRVVEALGVNAGGVPEDGGTRSLSTVESGRLERRKVVGNRRPSGRSLSGVNP